jgi:UDP-2,4-diacetamido-2,4,6-trideoxy-beta-L-altropyranose hydrolase
MGHVVRCLTLAKTINEQCKSNIIFAIRESASTLQMVGKSFEVLTPQKNNVIFNYSEWIVLCINKIEADVLILDVRDGLREEDLKNIKKITNTKIITIDDPEDKRLKTDMAFYPPIPQLKLWDWDGYEGQLFSGWQYVILRSEFQVNYSKPKKKYTEILVAMGATDPHNMTLEILNAIIKFDLKVTLKVLIGPQFRQEKKLNHFCEQTSNKIIIEKNPKNVAKIMSSADIAVLSFGMTAYEVAALNIPALYICISPDHVLSAEAFVKAGFGISLGLYDNLTDSLIQTTLNDMIEKKTEYCVKLTESKLIDGLGAHRTAEIIINENLRINANG